MAQKAPAPATPSAAPRAALIALAVALVGAIAYIAQLRGQVSALEARLATASAPARSEAKPAPTKAVVAAAAPAPTIVPAADIFTAAQKVAMADALRGETDTARKAWFLVRQNDAQTAAVAAAFREVFEQAGWPTETTTYPNPLKSGVFLLAGETDPPGFVSTVNDALAAGNLDVQFLTGYREFVSDRKKTPGWFGPELAEGQVFTIVIGSRPALKAGS
jgi:hypothetical protein